MKAKPSHLYKPEDGTSCRRYILTVDHAIDAIPERFFDTLISNLLPGDEITVKQFDKVNDDMGKSMLLARQDFEVLGLDHADRRVLIIPRGDVVMLSLPEESKPEIKWNAGKKMHQVVRGGDVLFESADKGEAKAFAEAA